ncbi:PIN domain-containing protein [uncultured Duncaniella sp.]|uniref:PIN domain-containing protein n=1 Tax=uncultured Duncaniella sp. TaxID=2768039 RepID=UPI0025B6E844|nr:PIN domain-containing protein [uncultured Duncaniella sp.]
MKILVNDTNIFIDLHSVGLLEEMCRLPYEIHTVDLVVAEIADADQRRIFDELVARGEISVDGFTADEVIEIVEEHSSVSGNLSIPDCSVCYFARKHNVPMLTGDRRLRRYAEEQSIEVHGILFIFDELVRHDIISTSMAADRLEELFAINARLPKAEIRNRINRWRNN